MLVFACGFCLFSYVKFVRKSSIKYDIPEEANGLSKGRNSMGDSKKVICENFDVHERNLNVSRKIISVQ